MNVYKKLKGIIYLSFIPFIRFWKLISWNYYLKTHDKINLIIGSGTTKFKGWFATDIITLDVTKQEHFKKYFSLNKIDKILAEHVLEHLSNKDLDLMIKNFYDYSSEVVNIRIAVPDGYHKDKEYIDTVKPNGTGFGADDHKHLFNYETLSAKFEKFGFVAVLKEYWDENKEFYTDYSDDEFGMIRRSFKNDKRNEDGEPHYTSLIIDFKKE